MGGPSHNRCGSLCDQGAACVVKPVTRMKDDNMLRIPQINSANNPGSSGWCIHCAELRKLGAPNSSRERANSHPWDDLLEQVLRSWEITLRAALLLVIALAGVVAIVVALGVSGPGSVLDLPYYIVLRGRI